MNRLNLNALGVSEMSQEEMVVVEGGSLWTVLKKVAEVVGVAAVLEAFGDGFIKGVQRVMQHNKANKTINKT